MDYDPDKAVSRIRSELREIERELEGGVWATVSCSRGIYAIVDGDMQQHLSRHNWFTVVSKANHAYPVADIDARRVSMARLVLSIVHPHIPLDKIKQVSFENKCSFDCRSVNLKHRVGRKAVMRNRRGKSGSSSEYKGVRKREQTTGPDKFSAEIFDGHRRIGLGTYSEELEAARMYDAAAWLLFQNAAFMNVTSETPDLERIELVGYRIRKSKLRAKTKKETSNE